MAKKSKRYYDTSKYISMPVAIVGSVAVLIILVLVGMKYSAFNSSLLSAKPPQPPAPLTCAQKDAQCKSDANSAFGICSSPIPAEYIACLSDIPANHPARETLRADCLFAKNTKIMKCEADLAAARVKCEAEKAACIKALSSPTGEPLPPTTQQKSSSSSSYQNPLGRPQY